MEWKSQKHIKDQIKDCRRLINPGKIILCLEELFRATNDGMAAYTLGHEQEKIGNIRTAVKYYEMAESLFKEVDYKNMARSAINSLQVEAILAQKKREKFKQS